MTVIKILNSPKATIIPCLHVESGCSGLFNTITNEFYPVKTTEIEYIQSTETQYIDTGVQPKGGRMKIYKNHISTPNSVESCLEMIVALAVGYDGEITVEGFKLLIDEMADFAKDGQKFLLENKIHQEFIHVDEDYIYADLEEIIDATE